MSIIINFILNEPPRALAGFPAQLVRVAVASIATSSRVGPSASPQSVGKISPKLTGSSMTVGAMRTLFMTTDDGALLSLPLAPPGTSLGKGTASLAPPQSPASVLFPRLARRSMTVRACMSPEEVVAAVDAQANEVRRLKDQGLGNKDPQVAAAVTELLRLKALLPESS